MAGQTRRRESQKVEASPQSSSCAVCMFISMLRSVAVGNDAIRDDPTRKKKEEEDKVTSCSRFPDSVLCLPPLGMNLYCLSRLTSRGIRNPQPNKSAVM